MEDRQLYTKKCDFQARLNKGLHLVCFLLNLIPNLKKYIMRNKGPAVCADYSLNDTWKDLVYKLGRTFWAD